MVIHQEGNTVYNTFSTYFHVDNGGYYFSGRLGIEDGGEVFFDGLTIRHSFQTYGDITMNLPYMGSFELRELSRFLNDLADRVDSGIIEEN